MADSKASRGAQSEIALSNLATVLQQVWPELKDADKWQVGQSYAEATSDDVKLLAASLRRILMAVKGFDYVPETLRSRSYAKAANDVLTAHEGVNNFYTEPAPMRVLSTLGNTIPGPAFQICMQAALVVKLGNSYGHSYDAQVYADKLLKNLRSDGWAMYCSKFMSSDDRILQKLLYDRPISRLSQLIQQYSLLELEIQDSDVISLFKAAAAEKILTVKGIVKSLLAKLTGSDMSATFPT